MLILIGGTLAFSELLKILGRVGAADSSRDTTAKAWILLKTSRIQDSKI